MAQQWDQQSMTNLKGGGGTKVEAFSFVPMILSKTIIPWRSWLILIESFSRQLNICDYKKENCLDRIEHSMGKGNAGYHHFLLFPQCFQKTSLGFATFLHKLWYMVFKEPYWTHAGIVFNTNATTGLHFISVVFSVISLPYNLWPSEEKAFRKHRQKEKIPVTPFPLY